MTSIPEQVARIREAATITYNDHVSIARVSGSDAIDLVEYASAREIFLRDCQMLLSVFLDEEARVRADVEIGRHGDDFYVLAEGMSASELVAFLNECCPAGAAARVHDLSESHRIVALNGTYACEFLAEMVGPEVMGLPYLTLFEGDGFMCMRSGKTGEYGYYLMTRTDDAEALAGRLLELGVRFDVLEVGLEALDQCMLENGFMCMRAADIRAYNPIELQQQWRVSYDKDYAGSDALRAIREAGVTRRTCHMIAERAFAPGDDILCGDEVVGTLLHTGYSSVRGDWVGLAVVRLDLAYPGLRVLAAGDDRIPVVTRSAPVINNRSIYVNSQQHSYMLRHARTYPSLVLDDSWVASAIGKS